MGYQINKNIKRRPNPDFSPHYRISPATSPTVSPNQSVDKAMRDSRDQEVRKNSQKGFFGGFFSRRDKHDKENVILDYTRVLNILDYTRLHYITNKRVR